MPVTKHRCPHNQNDTIRIPTVKSDCNLVTMHLRREADNATSGGRRLRLGLRLSRGIIDAPLGQVLRYHVEQICSAPPRTADMVAA